MVLIIIKDAPEKEEIENQERKKEAVAIDQVTNLKLYTKRKKKDISKCISKFGNQLHNKGKGGYGYCKKNKIKFLAKIKLMDRPKKGLG